MECLCSDNSFQCQERSFPPTSLSSMESRLQTYISKNKLIFMSIITTSPLFLGFILWDVEVGPIRLWISVVVYKLLEKGVWWESYGRQRYSRLDRSKSKPMNLISAKTTLINGVFEHHL